MLSKNVHTFIGCESTYEEAGVVMFGVPFDSTTSYRPGTRFASSAIRNESYSIETYSPYVDRDLCDYRIFDGGDLELPFGNVSKVLEMIEGYTDKILADSKIPCMVGGEHLVTLGAIRAAQRKYEDLHIIHFDAHADLREEYLGEVLSHATVMRRCWDILGDDRIFQFGIRSGDKSEFQFARSHTTMHKFDFVGLDEVILQLRDKPVYFTLDLDVLDSGVFPGTGTPEAGGVSFNELLEAVKKVMSLQVVGLDMNELSPVYDATGASTSLACKMLRELLLLVYE